MTKRTPAKERSVEVLVASYLRRKKSGQAGIQRFGR